MLIMLALILKLICVFFCQINLGRGQGRLDVVELLGCLPQPAPCSNLKRTWLAGDSSQAFDIQSYIHPVMGAYASTASLSPSHGFSPLIPCCKNKHHFWATLILPSNIPYLLLLPHSFWMVAKAIWPISPYCTSWLLWINWDLFCVVNICYNFTPKWTRAMLLPEIC